MPQHGGGGSRGGGLRLPKIIAISIAITALCIAGSGGAQAAYKAKRHFRTGIIGFSPSPIGELIVLDADTGRVLSESNADAVTYPASLTKMMTLYLTFEALNTGRLRLDQLLPVSVEAASKSPTKLGLRPGDVVAVQDLIFGIVTRSANDAAAVLAEGLGGSEPAFAEMMNRKAAQLGMRNTYYRNASGLPDPAQHTTARDTAQLALALYHDFPREYRYFATRSFVFRGVTIVGHDHLLDWYPGADGIKTGYIRASGFNLATSAVRGGHRLVGVVLGGLSGGSRDRQMGALLDQGFASVGVAPASNGRVPCARQSAGPTQSPLRRCKLRSSRQPIRRPHRCRRRRVPSRGYLSKAASRARSHIYRRSPRPKPRRCRPEPQRPGLVPSAGAFSSGAFRAASGRRKGGARCRQSGGRQGQAAADCRARQGKRKALPRAAAQLHAAGGAERLRRTAQEEDRVLGGRADDAQGCGALNAGSLRLALADCR